MNINQFFEEMLGVTLRNPRWSWGAIDEETNRVFLRVWQDQIRKDHDGERVQVYWKHPRTKSPGYSERLKQLDAIRNGAEGIGVVTIAKDTETDGAREIIGFQDDPLLKLGELSEDVNGTYARVVARISTNSVARSRELTAAGQNILQLLVNWIREGRFEVEHEESFMGYGQAHKELGLERRGPHWGNSLRLQGLADLAVWLRLKDLPAATGLIVDQTNFAPGDGYYQVNGRPLNDRPWWMNQVKEAIAFDWSPYVEDDAMPTIDELSSYSKAIIEGTVNTISAAVRSRCDALRKRARQFYRDVDLKLRCEICGWHKPDNRISGDIVELHHLRPLANLPTDGVRLTLKEAIQALVPLCPCCHRIAHSRIGGSSFTLEQLKSIIPRYGARANGDGTDAPNRW